MKQKEAKLHKIKLIEDKIQSAQSQLNLWLKDIQKHAQKLTDLAQKVKEIKKNIK